MLGRTVGGRLTTTVRPKEVVEFDGEDASLAFGLAAAAVLIAVALAGYAAASWWADPKSHYHVGYVIYALLGLFLGVTPSLLAFATGNDVPFPTLFRTIANLENWLRAYPVRQGPVGGSRSPSRHPTGR